MSKAQPSTMLEIVAVPGNVAVRFGGGDIFVFTPEQARAFSKNLLEMVAASEKLAAPAPAVVMVPGISMPQ